MYEIDEGGLSEGLSKAQGANYRCCEIYPPGDSSFGPVGVTDGVTEET